jgi:predicted GNAT family acetyltransferase
MRGKGLAEALVKRGIEDARKEGRKIMPLCSFVRTEFRRHPDWSDLLAG